MMDSLLAAVPPALGCQTFFLATAAAILALQALPRHLRAALTEYGARRCESHDGDGRGVGTGDATARRTPGDQRQSGRGQGSVASLADLIRSHGQVPHSWFWHYYLASISWSVFWAWQYLARGSVLEALARAQAQADVGSGAPSTRMGRVVLAWSMLALQGTRRTYECFWVCKPGRTPMLSAHWVMGLAFYTFMNTAVWVHGSDSILATWTMREFPVSLTLREFLALALFFVACIKQNECHRYLASLKKYTLPSEGLFRRLVCPHYACELVIYLAIALMAAPAGSLFNPSVLCGVAFVATNLGVTAHDTMAWYADKFGPGTVAGRWKVIPFVF